MKLEKYHISESPQIEKIKDPNIESAVGKKIKELRISKKMSLKELSKLTDLTPGSISQIERGLANPSLKALRRMAQELGVPVFYFFMEDEIDESEIIVRHNRRKVLKNPDSNVSYELLSPNLSKRMEIISVELKPGERSSDDYFTHEGEEACIILSGRVTVFLGETSYELETGDCVQFNAGIPHRYCNNYPKSNAHLLYIISPPSF